MSVAEVSPPPTHLLKIDDSITYYEHISWISNVSGRLFFHLTNGYNYRNDRIVGDVLHYNEKVNGHRIFFLSMLVDLRDLKERGKSQYTRVIILAKTLTDDSIKILNGNVYFIDDKNHTGLYKSEDEISFTRESKELTRDNKTDYSQLEQLITEYIDNAKQNNSVSFEEVEFTLRETGVIFLKKENDISNDKEVDPDIKAAFHLLKFTFHKDRFHHTSAEEIIRIIPTNTSKLEIANKLVVGVKRHIAEVRKNEATPVSLQRLKGIVDYAQTLVTVLSREDFYSDDKQSSRENELLEKVDKSLDKELESKPYRSATIYQFIGEIQSIAVVSLAVIAPFLMIYSKDFDSPETFINLVFKSTYICAFLTLTVVIFGFNMLYHGSMKATYIGKLLDYALKRINKIKEWSNPNIASKLNIFSRYVFPGMINIEMFIRRKNKNIKTILFLSTPIIVGLLVNEQIKRDIVISCSPFKSAETSSTQKSKDKNATDLIIKENIKPVILELKKIRENLIVVKDGQHQHNRTAKNLELNSTLNKIMEAVKDMKQEYKKRTIRAGEKIVNKETNSYSSGKITNFLMYRFYNGQVYKNSSITQVDELQNILELSGLRIDPKEKRDQYFGSSTHKAVLKFQAMAKITQDGIVGEKTREALNNYISYIE